MVERHVVAAVALCFLPFTSPMLWLGLLRYGVRLWGMEAVYHRYFSHRTYKTGRQMQFVLALIGAQTGQRGPPWWAS